MQLKKEKFISDCWSYNGKIMYKTCQGLIVDAFSKPLGHMNDSLQIIMTEHWSFDMKTVSTVIINSINTGLDIIEYWESRICGINSMS